MRIRISALLVLVLLILNIARAHGTVTTFTRTIAGSAYTLAGRDPALSGTTVVPTVLVPITLTFEGKSTRMDAVPLGAEAPQSGSNSRKMSERL